MSEIEFEEYQQCINRYEKIEDNIADINTDILKQYDESINKNDFLYNHIVNLNDEYINLLEIKFPDKYTGLYKQLIYTKYVLDISNNLAYATFDPILDKNIDEYFPPNEINQYKQKLKKQLINPNYIPSDISSPDFEQIYFKIIQEYIEGNKSAPEIYDELQQIFYNNDFIKDLK